MNVFILEENESQHTMFRTVVVCRWCALSPSSSFCFSLAFLIFPSTSLTSHWLSLSRILSSSSDFVSQQEEGPSGKQAAIVPLVIPVSVPVHRSPADSQGCWDQARLGQGERSAGEPDRKPSVIVARRRSLRNSASESFEQVCSRRRKDVHCFQSGEVFVFNVFKKLFHKQTYNHYTHPSTLLS